MWIVEVVNSLDSYRLDTDGGLIPRDVDRVWAIFTSPFLHAGWQHLIDNTIPFVFMGVIIAMRGRGQAGPGDPHRDRRRRAGDVADRSGRHRDRRGQWRRLRLRHLPVRTGPVRPQRAADLHRRHRRRRMGRGAALERRAPRRDLLAGARVRRHRRRHRRVAAGWAPDHVRSAPTPRWRRTSTGWAGDPPPRPCTTRSIARWLSSLRATDAHLLRHPAHRAKAPGQLHRRDHPVRRGPGPRRRHLLRRRPARDHGRLRARRRCARRSTTPPRRCWPRGWTRRAASSSARATSRSTPSCAGCCRR